MEIFNLQKKYFARTMVASLETRNLHENLQRRD